MKLRLAIVFALLAYASVAQAQLPLTGAGRGTPGGGASFTGPGDAVSGATAFYSCARAYTAAYASGAGNLCDVADVGTGATTCTMKAAATGFADLTSNLCAGGTQTVSAFCTAHTSCVVTRMYDQTVGNLCTAPTTSCDVVQPTLANMPALTFSAVNSLPCVTFASTQTMLSATALALAQPFTFPVASKRTGNLASNQDILSSLGGNPTLFYTSSANTVGIFSGTGSVTKAATDSAFHGIQGIFNGASSAINVDNGTATTGSPGTQAFASQVTLAKSAGFVGVFCEGGVWPIAFSSGQQSTWFSNANGSSGYNGGL